MLWLIVVVIGIFTYNFYSSWKLQKQLGSIQPVSKVPFIGCIWKLSFFQPETIDFKFKNYIKNLGRSFYAVVLGELILLTAEPRIVSKVLTNQKTVNKNFLYTMLERWLGNGLLLASDHQWQAMRKILIPAFHQSILEQFVEVFERQSQVFIEILKEKADGKTAFNIYPHLSLLTFDIIAETAMGVSVNVQLKSNTEILHSVNEVTRIVSQRFIRPFMMLPLTFKLFTPFLYKKQNDCIKIMHNFADKMIHKRRDQLLKESEDKTQDKDSNSNPDAKKKKMALLDMLLQSKIDDKPLTDTQIRDEVNTFMFAGHDTTASATSFCLYLLSRHPEVQMKLYHEIKNYYGEDWKTRKIIPEDLNNMEYLTCVIKESMRIFPPIPAIARLIEEDIEIDEIIVPAKTNMIILIWWLLNDPELYENPHEFKPERHRDVAETAFMNVPFSLGPRNCIGRRFAFLEMKTVIIQVLRNFELIALGDDVVPSIHIVLRSKTGIQIGLRPRKE